jgi:tetratricopeptide (TPR) repeat protein
MLRPSKKITRKELKEDKLVSTYSTVTSYYEQNKRTISIALLAAAIVIAAIVIYVRNRADANEKAHAALGAISGYIDNGQYQTAIDGVPGRNIQGLRAIVENFGNSPGGELARFQLASSLLALGKYDEALEHYKSFSPPNALLESGRRAGLGACYEARKEYEDAGSEFEKAAAADPKDPRVPEFLHNAARNYAAAGEKEKAVELWKRLKKSHPATPYGRDAERYIVQYSL